MPAPPLAFSNFDDWVDAGQPASGTVLVRAYLTHEQRAAFREVFPYTLVRDDLPQAYALGCPAGGVFPTVAEADTFAEAQ